MAFAYVTLNLVDMWGEPRFNSERVSQMLCGTIVSLGQKKDGYVRITQADGYTGWVNEQFLKPISSESAKLFSKRANAVVNELRLSTLIPGKFKTCPPYFFHYGTRLYIANWRPKVVKAELPDGTAVDVRKTGLLKVEDIPKLHQFRSIASQARRFLGVSYLWGGISPAGFDCSGFIQTLFAQAGIYLPRDTKDQIKVGSSVTRDSIKVNDLLFFDRHVGLALRNGLFIHASAGGGGVQISSLIKGRPDYRADLDKSFREGRRVLK